MIQPEFKVPRVPIRSDSVLWVLVATGISGVAGYVVMWMTARTLGAAGFVVFGVFWSALYLVVGILFGLQQETTRAAAAGRLAIAGRTRSSLWIFGTVAGFVAGLLVVVTSVWWAPSSLGSTNTGLVAQIAIGAALNAVVATMTGVLAGLQNWRMFAFIVLLDGLLRLGGVALVLAFTVDPALIAWAVIAPFPLSIGIAVLSSPRRMIRLGRSPLGYREIAANSGHTVLAASATAVLINGFPLVLALSIHRGETAALGALIFAITLTRAPILVPLMALQSYFVTRFTNNRAQTWKLIGQSFGLIALVMAVLSTVTALWGTWALSTFVRPDFALSATALVPLVASSGFIGALCVTGPAVLARGQHRAYSLGWISASVFAAVILALPIGIEARAALALSIGPMAGLAVHILALAASGRRGAEDLRTD